MRRAFPFFHSHVWEWLNVFLAFHCGWPGRMLVPTVLAQLVIKNIIIDTPKTILIFIIN